MRSFIRKSLSASLIALLSLASVVRADDVLTVGSDAPEINVEHWVHDGNGKFKPVSKFESGKVYVIEFWATWCGPCIASMPHLVETQNKYADKGVQIVSISDEKLNVVEKFLERPYKAEAESKGDGDKADKEKADKEKEGPKTYGELTSAYCLTTDPDRSCYIAYMEAAGQNGIPTAFIVGKDRKIEWIGHPMEMDSPLADVVEGKWDRTKFAEEFKKQQEAGVLMNKIRQAMAAGKVDDAMKLIGEAIDKGGDSPSVIPMVLTRIRIALLTPSMKEEAPKYVTDAFDKYAADPNFANQLAWMLVQGMEADAIAKDEKLIKASTVAMEKSIPKLKGDTRAASLDTLAHLKQLSGDTDAAIKLQTEAVETASDAFKANLKEYLDELKSSKK